MVYITFVIGGLSLAVCGFSVFKKGFISIYGVRTEFGLASPYIGAILIIIGFFIIGCSIRKLWSKR